MGLYVGVGLVVLLATWYLWRSRPEDDITSGLPPGYRPLLDSKARSESMPGSGTGDAAPTGRKSPSLASADDDASADSDPAATPGQGGVAGAVARLAREPSYRIDEDHEDCQSLARAGVEAIEALYAAVEADAESWIPLYTSLAVVADGLGQTGWDAVAALLSRAVAQHHRRMVSFLDYAASAMRPDLCRSLCAQVDLDCASAFGEAAAHHGEEAYAIVTAQLGAAPPERAPALQQLLTALFSSSSFTDKSLWRGALKHDLALVRVAAALSGHHQKNGPELLALANDPDERVRHAFIVGAEEVPEATLLRLTKDPSPRVRAAACFALSGDSPEVRKTYERLLADPHGAVVLTAMVGLDEEDGEEGEQEGGVAGESSASDSPLSERLQAALKSSDPLLREVGVKLAGFLPKKRFVAALRNLSQHGTATEQASAIALADDEPEILAAIAELLRGSPPAAVLRAGEIELAFSDEPAAAQAAATLLSVELPARVRRAGFYCMAQHRDHWATHLGPLLHPGEPLLADLISELETALVGDQPIDGDLRDLFLRLKKRHPDTPLGKLAETALNR